MLLNYLKTTIKVLMRRKFLTFASLFGIAFTLIVLLTVTSMADQFIRPGGPEQESYRQLDVDMLTMWSKNRDSISVSNPGYKFLHENVRH